MNSPNNASHFTSRSAPKVNAGVGGKNQKLKLLRTWGKVGTMTTKEIALKTIEGLPDTASWADIEDRIRFLAAIEKGLEEITAGMTIPHEEVKESLKKWLSA